MQQLLSDIRHIIAQARERVARSVNHELVVAYRNIGRVIVEEQQQGRERATYGENLIPLLSRQLTAEFGQGFSQRQLETFRQLYLTFPNAHSLRAELTWTHYKLLVRIDDAHKRDFFIAESVKNAWSVRQLERQINSLLYERLLMSQDKDSVMAVAKGEATPTDPRQLIKDPTVLEFLGLKPAATYYEKELEGAIITHLQEFLLELGNGFSFVARKNGLFSTATSSKLTSFFTIACCNVLCCSTSKPTKSPIRIWDNCRCTSTITTAT